MKKHKIHKVVSHKFVYFVFIYDLQLFKSIILYPKSYVSTVIEAFVPFHQALSGNEVVDALRVVGDKMHQYRLASINNGSICFLASAGESPCSMSSTLFRAIFSS